MNGKLFALGIAIFSVCGTSALIGLGLAMKAVIK